MPLPASRPRCYFGVDLAWGEGTAQKAAKETGLVQLAESGAILDAGWARGVDAVVAWLEERARPGNVVAIDAPLVVMNESGMREAEREVAQRYMRWGVGANATNLTRPWQGGVTLRRKLEKLGFLYVGDEPPSSLDRVSFFECYPYTTLVGADELGYDTVRPRYKRLAPELGTIAEKRALRASECDELLRRMSRLTAATPRLDLRSHPLTADLLDSPSPVADVPYKHREDLIDAVISAWTAALWTERGLDRCQVLGTDSPLDSEGRRATIIAPARESQRRVDGRHSSRASKRDGPLSSPANEDGPVGLLILPDSPDTRLFIELSHFAGADLAPALDAIDLALEHFDADDREGIAGFLVDSAVMSYCRAFFPSNVRASISSYLDVPTEFASVHDRICEYRNMVIAHSQSALTTTFPLVVELSNGTRIAHATTISQSLPQPVLAQFAALVRAIAERVDELITEVTSRLSAQIEDAQPLDTTLVGNHVLVDTFTARSRRPPYPTSHTLYWSPTSTKGGTIPTSRLTD